MSDQSASNRIYSDAQLSDEVAVAGTPGFTSVTAMNLKTAGANTFAALPGILGQQFIPSHLVVQCKTQNTLTGNTSVSVGTTAAGTDIMGATALTGLTGVDMKFSVNLTGLQPAIAGNDATLDCTITGADSGTSGTADVFLHGYFIE